MLVDARSKNGIVKTVRNRAKPSPKPKAFFNIKSDPNEEEENFKSHFVLERRNLHTSSILHKHMPTYVTTHIHSPIDPKIVSGQDVVKSETQSAYVAHELVDNQNNVPHALKRHKYFPFPPPAPEIINRREKLVHLRSRLLEGGLVHRHEIDNIRKMAKKPKNPGPLSIRPKPKQHFPSHKKYPIYVDKGIIMIPTPNTPAPDSNTFGTPDQLT